MGSGDVLNPSVIRQGSSYYNFFSGYDGKAWHTGLAASDDGITWRKQGQILSSAANGSAIADETGILYYYQAGEPVQIGLARSRDAKNKGAKKWVRDRAPVLPVGPYGSWDERGVADPYVIRAGESYYMFYLGMDRARRQRLGVAESSRRRRVVQAARQSDSGTGRIRGVRCEWTGRAGGLDRARILLDALHGPRSHRGSAAGPGPFARRRAVGETSR